ncbi:GspH/FimT family pseudopilin [Acinetobacter modestus]|uniref:GspH/FimT family pseudopilin n=1 Tax=Acinetobacter modestus TaxID=1776740 RepID=UPI001F4B7B4F|nr:GspH/FimT family pseudopilin [Acinetobacter modestus]MCH7328886.1 GspH/FimT family pseudopilin [Acinetobacter modestus]
MGNSRGFTLVELMVTLVIIVIITTMAAPSLGNMLTQQKLDTSTRNFTTTLNQARAQASVLRTTVAVCPNKLATDADFTKEKCAQAAIPEYTATSGSPAAPVLTAAQKQQVLNTRVYSVVLDPKISVETTSDSFILFNSTGSVSAVKNFRLCVSGDKRLITITRLGIVSQVKNTGVCA